VLLSLLIIRSLYLILLIYHKLQIPQNIILITPSDVLPDNGLDAIARLPDIKEKYNIITEIVSY
jgi:hypothetical protein